MMYHSYSYYPRGGYQTDSRAGPLLPFLAGVLVTTPFIFLNNNKNNQQPYPVYPPYPYPQPYYPMPYYPY